MSIDRLRAHWGLSRTPFTKELATSMLFASAAHQEAVARVGWIISERALGVVCGEVGAGKTVAARAASSQLDSSRYSIIYLPNPAVGARGIYTQIVTALGATPRFYRATLIPQATDLIAAETAERGKTVVLILDEAHLLSAEQLEELRMLTNAEMDSRATFACLLLGQPTLRRKLRQGVFAALDQRIALRCTIDGIDRKETGDYIAHHVKLAGRSDTLFMFDLAERALAGDPYSATAPAELPFFAWAPDGYCLRARCLREPRSARGLRCPAPGRRRREGRGRSRARSGCLPRHEVAPRGGGRCRGPPSLPGAPRSRDRQAGLSGRHLPEPVDRAARLDAALLPAPGRSQLCGGPRPPSASSGTARAARFGERREGSARRNGGWPAPEAWTGWLKVPYRLGATRDAVRLRTHCAPRSACSANATAVLAGRRREAGVVVVGAHTDAWVNGAVDPGSGVAAVLESRSGPLGPRTRRVEART